MDQSFLSTVSTICEEVLLEEKNRVNAKGENVGNKNDNVNFSNHNPFIQWSTKAKVAISYLATSQLERVIGDLEAFSRHAKRSTITTDDLRLVCRRNDSISNTIFNTNNSNSFKEDEVHSSIDLVDFNLSDIDDLDEGDLPTLMMV